MRRILWLATAFMMLISSGNVFAESRWGAEYFPNYTLTDQDGKKVKFFDDLLKDKIVAINFIYTTCPDTCPLETAQLMRVQALMGDRIGKDINIYSITTDPEHDTPEILKAYKEKFGAKWQFFTGNREELIQIRRKLGLYIEEIDPASKNHNISMIIGNQTTGQWMKRSPFENPHMLADQLGTWLTGWKAAPEKEPDYAEAPELRSISKGEQLFRTRCATCHTVTGTEVKNALGPDLKGVNKRRARVWLLNWLRAPDQMLANKDPIALALFEQYNQLAMPNMRLNQLEARDILDYIAEESNAVDSGETVKQPEEINPRDRITHKKAKNDVVAVMNAWVREAHPTDKAQAGYFTLINVSKEKLGLIKMTSDAFKTIEIHEMVPRDGMMAMQEVKNVSIPALGQYTLAPGGKHLMLKEPVKHLKEGDSVEIQLIFDNGYSQTINIAVEVR